MTVQHGLSKSPEGDRRAEKIAAIERRILALVDSPPPPLTGGQRDRLALLLRGGSTPDRGAAA